MMRPAYLTNERLTLRPMVPEDAATAMHWFPAPFPVSPEQSGPWLEAAHQSSPWGHHPELRLVAVEPLTGRPDDGDGGDHRIVAGVHLDDPRGRTSWLRIWPAAHLSPERQDAIQAAIIDLIVPWARDELELMVLRVQVAADQPVAYAACEGRGMVLAARLREFVARAGHRVDLLTWEALNPNWPAPMMPVTDPAPRSSLDGRR